MIIIRNYHRAESLEDAWQLNQKRGNKVIGGMMWLKMSSNTISTAIDLSGLGLNTIEETDTFFSIGCMVTLRQLETHEGLNTYTQGAIRESLRHIVGVQFRNMATVGGSVYGRFGFSDVLTMLMAMDAYVELYKGGVIPIAEFADRPRDRDILVHILIKKTPGVFFYQSVRNSKTDFPVLACAASTCGGGLHLAVGGRPGKAVVCDSATLPHTVEDAIAFSKTAAGQIRTGSNMRGSAAYRTHLIEVMARRAAEKLGGIASC